MTQKGSIEHAKSAASVGKDVVIWGAGRSLELAFKGTEFALSIANRGLGKVVERGKITAGESRVTPGRALLDRSVLVQGRILEDYHETVKTTKGFMESTDNPDVVAAAKGIIGRAAKQVIDFEIQHSIPVELPLWRSLTEQVIDAGYPAEEIDYVHENLLVQATVSDVVSAEHSLEAYIGSIDPSVPRQLQSVGVSRIPHQSE